jgi:hypothetical protein
MRWRPRPAQWRRDESGLLDLHAMVELPRGNRPDGFARLPEIESFLKSETEHQMLTMYRAFPARRHGLRTRARNAQAAGADPPGGSP